jgi:hypothetical protein
MSQTVRQQQQHVPLVCSTAPLLNASGDSEHFTFPTVINYCDLARMDSVVSAPARSPEADERASLMAALKQRHVEQTSVAGGSTEHVRTEYFSIDRQRTVGMQMVSTDGGAQVNAHALLRRKSSSSARRRRQQRVATAARAAHSIHLLDVCI